MSRIMEGDCDDNASFLRACAFMANQKRALKGKKGRAVLKELEEALVAMPVKRLSHPLVRGSGPTIRHGKVKPTTTEGTKTLCRLHDRPIRRLTDG
jgi:hypothetical protein